MWRNKELIKHDVEIVLQLYPSNTSINSWKKINLSYYPSKWTHTHLKINNLTKSTTAVIWRWRGAKRTAEKPFFLQGTYLRFHQNFPLIYHNRLAAVVHMLTKIASNPTLMINKLQPSPNKLTLKKVHEIFYVENVNHHKLRRKRWKLDWKRAYLQRSSPLITTIEVNPAETRQHLIIRAMLTI